MDGQARILVWTAIVVAMVAALIVVTWPRRRICEVVIRRKIAAPADRIWDTSAIDLDDPLSAAFHSRIVSTRNLSTDPEIVEHVVDASGGHGTHQTVMRYERLATDRPVRTASRCTQVDDQPYPFGQDHVSELRLAEEPEATMAILVWRGETTTLAQQWAIRKDVIRYMDSLKAHCEAGHATVVPQSRRSPWRSLGLTALAFASFTFIFGWILALILSGAIVIHEFGHWLAMRMTGQPKPRIMLVPFLGGVAVPNQPYKSQFDDAFVSLMGAGISIVPCLALLAAAAMIGLPEISEVLKSGKSSGSVTVLAPALYVVASVVGLLNCLQLLPVLPLDGGHVLRSLVQSVSLRRARPILLGLASAGIVCFLLLEDYVLVAILALGAMQAWHLGNDKPSARPMGRAGMAAIGAAYLLIFGVHAGAVAYTMQIIGFELL